jgi:hypothetical protein
MTDSGRAVFAHRLELPGCHSRGALTPMWLCACVHIAGWLVVRYFQTLCLHAHATRGREPERVQKLDCVLDLFIGSVDHFHGGFPDEMTVPCRSRRDKEGALAFPELWFLGSLQEHVQELRPRLLRDVAREARRPNTNFFLQ